MSFEDQLRSQLPEQENGDRAEWVRDVARKCAAEFADGCVSFARMGKHSLQHVAGYTSYGDRAIVYAYPDERYELEKAKGSSVGKICYLRLSESELFMSCLKDAFQSYEMNSARVSMQEDVLSYTKRGMFGNVSTVRRPLGRYTFELSAHW